MRYKLVRVVPAIALPVGLLLATQTMASAHPKSSTTDATGSVSCSGAIGNIHLSPGWQTNSNTFPAPSTVTFSVEFNECSAIHPGTNVTTKVFGGRLKGSVSLPSNDCSTNFGGADAVTGAAVPIHWNKAAKVGPVTPAESQLTLRSATLVFNGGIGITITFSHQALTGSFGTKTLSGQLVSSTQIPDPCGFSSKYALKNIPIASGSLSQP
jgi:hypothetical protein